MARHAVAATAARASLVARLNDALAAGAARRSRPPGSALVCPIADRLAAGPALEVEDWLRAGLAADRLRDAAAGGAALGAHRADMALTDAATGVPAAQASTGEQKALLIGVILGHAALIAEARGFAPLAAAGRAGGASGRRAGARRCSQALAGLPAQGFMTGTGRGDVPAAGGHAEGLRARRRKPASRSAAFSARAADPIRPCALDAL